MTTDALWRRRLLRRAEGPEMLFCVDEEMPQSHSKRAVTEFLQGVAIEEFEFVASFDGD